MARPIGRGRPRRNDINEAKLREDYLDVTKTVAAIATEHNCDPSFVSRLMDRMGVPRRESAEFPEFVEREAKSA